MQWTQIPETAPLRVGLGFTMKVVGSALGNQTYTFVGKPNNGTIATNTVGDDQLLLTGNPTHLRLMLTHLLLII
jgi:hypothetical protein